MTCRICQRPAVARQLCHAHYKRWMLGKDLYTPVRQRILQASTCSVPGCELAPLARGLCRKHYQQQFLPMTPARRERHRITERARKQRLRATETA